MANSVITTASGKCLVLSTGAVLYIPEIEYSTLFTKNNERLLDKTNNVLKCKSE